MKAERRELAPTLPPADERQRLVHAVVRGVRGIVTNDHDRMCLLYCCVGLRLLADHWPGDYALQVGHIGVGTDATDIPDHMVSTESVPGGYHAWLTRQHGQGWVEVIDFSWGFFPRWAANVDLIWDRPDMPPFLWDWADGIGPRPKKYDVGYASRADLVAISRLAADGLGDNPEVVDAKHSILALTRSLDNIYVEYAYLLSMQLWDLVSAMPQPTEPTSEGDAHE